MRDVARHAGVSQPLVSLVLGGSATARVAEATRERVLRAARELGYRPNVLARGLVHGRSYALGLIVPDLRNPVFTDVVSGAERVAAEEGYAVLLCDMREISAEKHVDALRARQIDGIIIDAMGAALLSERLLVDLNVVLIDEPSEGWVGVVSDAAQAGRLAAEHLLGLGHRHIAFCGPASELWAFRMRERGFLQALRAAGVTVESDDLRRAPPSVAGGYGAMQTLLARAPRPTAAFFANDLMAIGALKACAAARVPVPDRLSIVGCDDIETARLVTPELTTITVRARELGARAARMLVRLMRGESVRPPKALAVDLVVRGTTGPVPAPDGAT
ncbi:MAG: LacI family DNA-binding transcriptional regulator [Gemmatimonadaceae bacterium]